MNLADIKETLEKCKQFGLVESGLSDIYEKDIEYLLSIIEQAEKALQYYANLNQNAYHDAMEGELYSDWWARQSKVAVEALQAIQGEG